MAQCYFLSTFAVSLGSTWLVSLAHELSSLTQKYPASVYSIRCLVRYRGLEREPEQRAATFWKLCHCFSMNFLSPALGNGEQQLIHILFWRSACITLLSKSLWSAVLKQVCLLPLDLPLKNLGQKKNGSAWPTNSFFSPGMPSRAHVSWGCLWGPSECFLFRVCRMCWASELQHCISASGIFSVWSKLFCILLS